MAFLTLPRLTQILPSFFFLSPNQSISSLFLSLSCPVFSQVTRQSLSWPIPRLFPKLAYDLNSLKSTSDLQSALELEGRPLHSCPLPLTSIYHLSVLSNSCLLFRSQPSACPCMVPWTLASLSLSTHCCSIPRRSLLLLLFPCLTSKRAPPFKVSLLNDSACINTVLLAALTSN